MCLNAFYAFQMVYNFLRQCQSFAVHNVPAYGIEWNNMQIFAQVSNECPMIFQLFVFITLHWLLRSWVFHVNSFLFIKKIIHWKNLLFILIDEWEKPKK